jgi:hypothetical protein
MIFTWLIKNVYIVLIYTAWSHVSYNCPSPVSLLWVYIMMFPVIQTLQCQTVSRDFGKYNSSQIQSQILLLLQTLKHDYCYNLLKIKILRFQFKSSAHVVWIIIRNKIHRTLWNLKQTPRCAELNSLLDIYHCTCTKYLTQLNTSLVQCDSTHFSWWVPMVLWKLLLPSTVINLLPWTWG